MKMRDEELVKIRPKIASIKTNKMVSKEEQFQNTSLRPIIKMQNELLIQFFKNYISRYKNVFYALNKEKQLAYIDNALQTNNRFKNKIIGLIIGLFTSEEFSEYLENSSALNRRVIVIVANRLKDNLQVLNAPIM